MLYVGLPEGLPSATLNSCHIPQKIPSPKLNTSIGGNCPRSALCWTQPWGWGFSSTQNPTKQGQCLLPQEESVRHDLPLLPIGKESTVEEQRARRRRAAREAADPFMVLWDMGTGSRAGASWLKGSALHNAQPLLHCHFYSLAAGRVQGVKGKI